jgi:hypothetical protein
MQARLHERWGQVQGEVEPMGEKVTTMADQMGTNIMSYRSDLEKEVSQPPIEMRMCVDDIAPPK